MKPASTPAVLLVVSLIHGLAGIYARKSTIAQTRDVDATHQHIQNHKAVFASAAHNKTRMSFHQLQGMEKSLVQMVMKNKASPGTNSAVMDIINILDTEILPEVVKRAQQCTLDLTHARNEINMCDQNVQAALVGPNTQRDKLPYMKTDLEDCLWAKYQQEFPVTMYPNNPANRGQNNVDSGTKLESVDYSHLSSSGEDPNPNPYLFPAAPECGWPACYAGGDCSDVDDDTNDADIPVYTPHVCEDTSTKCTAAKTACQEWEDRHFMDNRRDQINDDEIPTSKECDRRDFSSVGQYLTAMKEYWYQARTLSPNGYEPMKCYCDVQMETCQAAQLVCPHDETKIPSDSFYKADWVGLAWECNTSVHWDSTAPATASSSISSVAATTTTTTFGNFCQDKQETMDEVACEQTNGRIAACAPYASCWQAAKDSFDVVHDQVCKSPNGDKYTILNEYYGLLRMECVLNALYASSGTDAIMSATMLCVEKTKQDFDLTPVEITNCDPVPTCTLPADCDSVTDVASSADTPGTAQYRFKYYEHLQCPAPCLTSCCTSPPASINTTCPTVALTGISTHIVQ